jgi:hypothetical protein
MGVGFMNYSVEMVSGAMTYEYISSLIKIGFGIRKLLVEIRIETQAAW